ncbi:hypothetical protein KC976_00380 [Candidatus Saccharibacteria bacterium]|nr:hypothetical protein [Candidatus Saccharibacteria bacterium]HPG37364.1 hypothetical protein [Candidatus Saccharibacteria bacterium]
MRVFRIALLTALIFGVGYTLTNRWFLYDQWRLFNYQPSTVIAQLATEAQLTDSSRKVFYVNHPQVSDKADFAKKCPIGSEKTAILGCYHGNQRSIFVLNVDTPELQGIEQVTAAHELLHAEYDRLPGKQRATIDKQLQAVYDNLQNQDVKDTVDAYRKSEPDALLNEMHSIFATQLPVLPPALETYYKQYFKDRQAVVAAYAKYNNAFVSRQNQVKEADAQLAAWKAEMDQLEASLKQQQGVIAQRRANLQMLRGSNVAAYNAQVDSFNYLIDNYNNGVARFKQLVNQYNDLVATRNSVALEEQALVKAISSSSVPAAQ